MGKISLYFLLILVFLGISQSSNYSDSDSLYIKNKMMMGAQIEGAPICLVLIDYFKRGLFIKTYYHRYKLIHGFKLPKYITVRTSKDFYQQNLDNIGLSIFRRNDHNNIESTVPMPPGTLFIGNLAYGNWLEPNEISHHHQELSSNQLSPYQITNNKKKIWVFHRAYKNFTQILGMNHYRVTEDFYELFQNYLKQEKSFRGPRNEFGTNGIITRMNYPEFYKKSIRKKFNFKSYFKELFLNE
jgi:hypothetical protein